jgi:hypothetical protein
MFQYFAKYRFLIIMGFLIITPLKTVLSQNASLTLKNDSILIGEHTELEIKVVFNENEKVNIPWQTIYDSISAGFDIVRYEKIDTTYNVESLVNEITQTLVITSWEEGMHVIYPISIDLESNGDKKSIESNAALLSVYLVEIDAEMPPKDIKPILSVPITFKEMLPWILGTLFILLSAWLLYKYRFIFLRKTQLLKEERKPDIPAHIIALEELENLKKKKLWQDGKVKAFHVELSTIIRNYIELRYGIIALEMTTDETLASVKSFLCENPEQLRNLERVLTMADLVKFAKHQPLADENSKNLDLAFDFVYHTIEKIEDL